LELLKKHLLFISLAFIIGVSLSSVQAISPFTEIGNLEMETLNAINDIIISLNAEIVRIDSLNATEISEQIEQDGMQFDIATLQEQTKSIVNGKFACPGIIVNPTQERAIGSVADQSHLPIIVDFEFTSFRNHIVFTNGTIVDIPGPHLLPSFFNSVNVFFKERLTNGTVVNHSLCSLTAGDSISECNLIGWNSTVVPQRPTVSYTVDSDAPTSTFTVFDFESIFSITTTTP